MISERCLSAMVFVSGTHFHTGNIHKSARNFLYNVSSPALLTTAWKYAKIKSAEFVQDSQICNRMQDFLLPVTYSL